MRALKVLLAGVIAVLAVTAGLFVAMVVALSAVAALVVRRFVRKPVASRPNAAARPNAPRPADAGAIDVVATEVRPEPETGRSLN